MLRKGWSLKERLQAVSFIILVLILIFGWCIEQMESNQISNQITPTATEQAQSTKDNILIDVFFTDPKIPFDNVAVSLENFRFNYWKALSSFFCRKEMMII